MRRLTGVGVVALLLMTFLTGRPAVAAEPPIDLPVMTVTPQDGELLVQWQSVPWPVERRLVGYMVRAVAREKPSWLRVCLGNASYSLPWPGGWMTPNASYAPGPRACIVRGLVNGWTYDVYLEVSSTEAAGKPLALGRTPPSTATLCCTVASNPFGVTARAAGRRGIAVAWTAPEFAGGASSLSYVVRTVPASAGCRTNGTSCTIAGLTPGRTYQVQVIARNSAGDSPPGAAPPVRLR